MHGGEGLSARIEERLLYLAADVVSHILSNVFIHQALRKVLEYLLHIFLSQLFITRDRLKS